MTMPPELEALKNEAMLTSCEAWAMRHRWKLAPGIDRAGPCPVCGGSDRFAIHTKKNTFNCRRCGIAGGGVIDLVMQVDKVEFVKACEIITGRTLAEPVDEARMAELRQQADRDEAKRAADEERRRRAAVEDGQRIVKSAIRPNWYDPADDGVAGYLRRRGLLFGGGVPLPKLGEIGSHPWTEMVRGDRGFLETRTVAVGVAMIGAVQLPDNSVGAAHQTWIDLSQEKGKAILPPDDAGKDRPAKKTRGTVKGGAIRLYTPEKPRRLIMGEGIETTLTAMVYAFEPDTAYWAGVAAGNMAGRAARDAAGKLQHDLPDLDDPGCFVSPDWCAELIFLTDGDGAESRIEAKMTRGLLRAQALRERARAANPDLPLLDCSYTEPIGDGRDLNDLVRVVL